MVERRVVPEQRNMFLGVNLENQAECKLLIDLLGSYSTDGVFINQSIVFGRTEVTPEDQTTAQAVERQIGGSLAGFAYSRVYSPDITNTRGHRLPNTHDKFSPLFLGGRQIKEILALSMLSAVQPLSTVDTDDESMEARHANYANRAIGNARLFTEVLLSGLTEEEINTMKTEPEYAADLPLPYQALFQRYEAVRSEPSYIASLNEHKAAFERDLAREYNEAVNGSSFLEWKERIGVGYNHTKPLELKEGYVARHPRLWPTTTE